MTEFWIDTPGHSYLVVPIEKVRASGAEISPYSWMTTGGMAYLEEDCDAPAYLSAAGITMDKAATFRVKYQGSVRHGSRRVA